MPPTTVQHASVVLVSPSPIDPQSISPDTLSRVLIIPSDWPLGKQQISSPVFAITQYQNGVSIQIDGNRCIFQEVIGGSLRLEYEIQKIARRYIESTALVPYNAVGINWLLNIAVANPTEWIREQIGHGKNFPDFSPTLLQIARPLKSAVCNLTFRVQGQIVVVDCNYHFQLSSSLQPLAALDLWHQCQEALDKDVFMALSD